MSHLAPVLELNAVVKTYRTRSAGVLEALRIQAFSLGPGEIVGLEGPSGSGKSTFLALACGILKPNEGSVRLAGVDLAGLFAAGRDRHRARTVGLVSQTLDLLQGLDVLTNVAIAGLIAGRNAESDARHLLERLGLGDRLRHRVDELSVGQRQRVAVARALVNRPALVLADEPTGSLDAQSASEAVRLLLDRCKEAGAAMVLVSHDDRVLGSLPRRISLRSLRDETVKL